MIFVTARTDADSVTRALESGGVDFIHKPVNTAVVRARVQVQLDLRRRTRELEGRLVEVAQAHEHGLTLEISASIGVALYPDHGQDAITLARHADESMYLAKQAGGDGLRLCSG